jgi:acetyl/propionyl-CoA carboxylase alpha subunit
MKYRVILGDKILLTDVKGKDRSFTIELDGERVIVKIEPLPQQGIFAVFLNEKPYLLSLKEKGGKFRVESEGYVYELEVTRGLSIENSLLKTKRKVQKVCPVKSPLSGLIASVKVKPGDEVEEGEALLVIESMKMRNELKSPHRGIIREIKVKEGSSIERGAEILVIERIE